MGGTGGREPGRVWGGRGTGGGRDLRGRERNAKLFCEMVIILIQQCVTSGEMVNPLTVVMS